MNAEATVDRGAPGGAASPLNRIVADARIVVCCGSGGVGKTTTAAAVALRAAELGRRTCVLTIDPARRLAQALGLDLLSNTPRPVRGKGIPGGDAGRGDASSSGRRSTDAGRATRAGGPPGEPAKPPGGLDAMMLDMRRTFDEVIERYARDEEQAERILANRFYQRLSSTLAGTHEYMAMEKLYELHESRRYDLLVVDTPPTRSALDFLDAPEHLNELLDARVFRLLIGPARRVGSGYLKGLNLATTAMTRMIRRLTGSELLAEVGEFFAAFEGMYDGFKDRAQRVYRLLKHPSTAFVVVATPEPGALREARYFADRLAADRMPLGALVVNRVHQVQPLPEVPPAAMARLAAGGADARLLADLLEQHHADEALAAAEQERIAALLARVPSIGIVQVPLLADDVHDLAGLRRLGTRLFA
jgi:anion-transporting  ArsA/GET3 family ATPase